MPQVNSTKKAMAPYDYGVIAARIGLIEDCNPYRPGTNEHSDWQAGFKDFAEDDDFLDTN